jgi:hypothetical protein
MMTAMLLIMMMFMTIIIIIIDLKPKWVMACSVLCSYRLCASASILKFLLTISSCCQVLPPAILLTRFSTLACERGEVVSLTKTANVEHQASIFMYLEDKVAVYIPNHLIARIPRDCHFPYPLSYRRGHQFM